MKNKAFLFFVSMLLSSMLLSITVHAYDDNPNAIILPNSKIPVSSETDFSEALKLINEQIKIEMTLSSDSIAKQLTLTNIDYQLKVLGVKELSVSELTQFLENSNTPDSAHVLLNSLMDNNGYSVPERDTLPIPPSNDKIKFQALCKQVDGVNVYSIIASPVANADHSCNTVTSFTDVKGKLQSLLNKIHIYTDKTISAGLSIVHPLLSWIPYEQLTNLVFSGSSPNQLEMYEARLMTRTVHQFIYVQNSAGQFAYYGSANCVHINLEEIARKYVGSALKTETHNEYVLDLAPDYYNWPAVCTNGNLTGYAVQLRHSFVRNVSLEAEHSSTSKTTIIKTPVVTAEFIIQVAR